jgi:hypothetical protein
LLRVASLGVAPRQQRQHLQGATVIGAAC